MDNFALTSKGVSSSSRLDLSDPGTFPSKPEPKSIALRVINEPKEENEDMLNDLRTYFKERHRKCLHEAIDMVPPPAKRACSEGVREEPGREVPSMLVPSLDVVGPSSVPAIEEKAGLAPRRASGGIAIPEEVLDQKNTPAPSSLPSWDEIMEMLKHISCYTDAEPPFTKMSDFFPLTK